MQTPKNQLKPITNNFQQLDKSKGILDDYPIRKSIETREITSTKGYAIIMQAGEDLVKGNVLRVSRVADGQVLKAGLN